MSQRHYQLMVLGDSLASSLAAVLLSKQGVRVLSFQRNSVPDGPWFPSSLLLERILELLGGLSCYTSPIPFQVITDRSRVEFNGVFPLEEELRREFADCHPRLAAMLGNLDDIAQRFENHFWPTGMLPLYGNASHLNFAWQKLRSGRFKTNYAQPLSGLLAEFNRSAAGDFLQLLFSGLAQMPLERLSVIEGALLWAGVIRKRSVSPSGLDALLRHRFEQFHGATEDIGAIQKIKTQEKRLTEVVLQNGNTCSADWYLIDAPQVLPLLPADLQRADEVQHRQLIATSIFPEDQFPPVLAPRVLLAGKNPLRLSFVARDRQVQCTLKTFRTTVDDTPTAAEMQRALADILPFAQISCEITRAGGPLPAAALRTPFPGFSGSLLLGGNAVFHYGPSLLPALGAQGEVLAGLSTARFLSRLAPKK